MNKPRHKPRHKPIQEVQKLDPRSLRATLRLQFHRGFSFDDALAQLDYYAALGVSHLYASPVFTARSGSTHGYDVVDPSRVNPELGGEDGLRRLVQGLHALQMGLIVDIVPNHMAIGEQNPWWCDVLLWGQQSQYASWFDIEWQGIDPALHGKVLLPVLGRTYGEMLGDGESGLKFDPESTRFHVEVPGNRLPVAPETYVEILSMTASPHLKKATAAFERVREVAGQDERKMRAEHAWRELAQAAADVQGMAALNDTLAAFDTATSHGAEALHALLERQHYRLCDWRNAGDELNWRRFFEIGDLIGMRVEQDDVFEAMHATLFRLYEDGLIDGVRIDHIDGLADPAAYAQRLRRRLQDIRSKVALDMAPYIIAEKILAPGEDLRNNWGLDGTTGYDFMDQVSAVLHDPAGTATLDAIWQEYSDDAGGFDNVVRAIRPRLLDQNFANEFNALNFTLHALARSTIATRDISLMSIRRCMLVLLAYFPVYRSYGTQEGCDSRDVFIIRTAAASIGEQLSKQDLPTLDAITGWLTEPQVGQVGQMGKEDQRRSHLHWRALTRFQQLTPPLTAKSSEDTAFYRYGRLLSRNEVGSDPSQLVLPVEDFHRDTLRRQRDFPRTMLATATHDHKRGEESRMRLAVLSEIPTRWQQALQRWRALNTAARTQTPIDAVDELMLYQTLVGVWPLADANDTTPSELTELTQRLSEWQRKALREAKRHTDWKAPDLAYEANCDGFLRRILRPNADNLFLPALRGFIQEIAAAGALNSLSQTMLRLTAPGIPDLYQGCDLWDFSLVDPDNRRPVDYALRRTLMARQEPLESPARQRLEDWRSGACKQHLIRSLLQFRRGRADLFTTGSYVPLMVEGELADHLVAFARSTDELTVIVLCSRHAARLIATDGAAPSPPSAIPLIPPQSWRDTVVRLPPQWATGEWQSVLSGRQGAIRALHFSVADLLHSFPVELLLLSR